MAMKMGFAKDSLTGNRNENQDSLRFCYGLGIFAIADGVSSCPNSKEGSRLATKAAVNFLENKMDRQKGMPADWVVRAMQEANAAVYKRNLVKEGSETYLSKDADTTLDVILVYHKDIYGAHIGDSRVYTVSTDGKLEQVTTDHSTNGCLNKVLGASENITPGAGFQVYTCPLAGCRRIFMATDGIYKALSDEELLQKLSQKKRTRDVLDDILALATNPDGAAKKYAEERGVSFEIARSKLGGHDNMTGLILTVEGD